MYGQKDQFQLKIIINLNFILNNFNLIKKLN
jgi:hypothetical protein